MKDIINAISALITAVLSAAEKHGHTDFQNAKCLFLLLFINQLLGVRYSKYMTAHNDAQLIHENFTHSIPRLHIGATRIRETCDFRYPRTVNCQYVLPVRRDKLPENAPIHDYEVLSLAQDDKLFRI